MGEETVLVDPGEDFESLLGRLRQSPTKNLTLLLASEKSRALNSLENFQALRKMAREEGYTFTVSGGGRTAQGLAKVLGFRVETREKSPLNSGDTPFYLSPAFSRPIPEAQPGSPGPSHPNGNLSLNPNPQSSTSVQGGFKLYPNQADPHSLLNLFEEIPDLNDPVHQAYTIKEEGPAISEFNPPESPWVEENNPPTTFLYPFPGLGIQTRPIGEGDPAPKTGYRAKKGPNFQDSSRDSEGSREDTPSESSPAFFRTGEGPPPEERFGRISESTRGFSSRPYKPPPLMYEPEEEGALSLAEPNISNPVNKPSKLGSIPKYQSGGQRVPKKPLKFSYFPFILLFGGMVALVIIIGFLFLSPTPTLSVSIPGIIPEQEVARLNLTYKTIPLSNTLTLSLEVSPSTSPSGAANTTPTPITSPGNGPVLSLPLNPVSPGNLSVKGDYPAFGSRLEPYGTASGTLTVINGSTRPVSYEAGKIIYNNKGISFRLRDPISVAGGNVLAGTQGKASGVVVADRPGSVGNLPNGFVIYLTDSIAVQSGPITGGTEISVKVVSQGDIDALKKTLVEKAQVEAQASLKEKYNPSTQQLLVLNNLETTCQFNKAPGDVSNIVSGSCSFTPQGYTYNRLDLQRVLQENLVTDPRNKLVPNSLNVTGEGLFKSDNGRLTLQVPVKAQTYSPVDLARVKEALADRLLTEVPQVISSEFPQVEHLEIGGVKGNRLPRAEKLEVFTTPGDSGLSSNQPTFTPAGVAANIKSPVPSFSPRP